MSEPITLTERERAVWASYASFLEGVFTNPVTREQQLSGPQIAASIEAWLDECPTEPASPPRVPVSSAHFTRVGVQSGPGQPMNPAMGHLQNIASAAKANKAATELPYGWRMAWESIETQANAAIRALADKPAPDAARKGG